MTAIQVLRHVILTIGSIACSLATVAQGTMPLSEAEWITGSTHAAMPRSAMAEGTEYGTIKVNRKFKDRPFTLKKGETAVIDMGQNMVGWGYFEAKAERGTEILFRHGEMLNDNGDRRGRLDDGPGGSVATEEKRSLRIHLDTARRSNLRTTDTSLDGEGRG